MRHVAIRVTGQRLEFVFGFALDVLHDGDGSAQDGKLLTRRSWNKQS